MHPAEGLRIRVVPPVVTVLLKIIAYMEDPYRRAKDLQNICVVLARYEAQSDRLFSDAVFDAELPDFEVANAFLLGLDLRALVTNDDATYVKEFLEHFLKQEEERHFDEEDFSTKAFRSHRSGLLQCIRRSWDRPKILTAHGERSAGRPTFMDQALD